MSLKTLRHSFVLNAVCSRRKAWTSKELAGMTGIKEQVLIDDLSELCTSGKLQRAQVQAEQRTYFFSAEGIAC
ncbi:MAG: hypothetical protein ACRC9O_03190 [Plesiomonas sp.]|uniref:hypothetical protein n=1 Tax=Plesiomonas sp. TaxID=2486279 RepID=UPI003F2EDE16